MTIWQKLMEKLEARRRLALLGGGQKKIDARHAKGQLTARERIMAMVHEGTFQEFGMHARPGSKDFGLDKKEMPGDGVVTGVGFLDGRSVGIVSQDFTVSGGSLGRTHAKKICDLMDFALDNGMPIVAFNDSGGARIQEGVGALAGYGQVFYRNVKLSGVVPQIAVIAGPCAGGAAYSPALMDFIIMTKNAANMFICGPEVIKAATGEQATLEQFASAAAHATVSGNVHLVANDDLHAIELAKKLLSFLPSNNMSDPPHDPTPHINMARDEGVTRLLPADSKTPLDTKQVIRRIVDKGDFFEIMTDFARNIIIGFARIEGVVVGIVANQSMVKAGTLDIDASDKAARFVRTCNIFNVPLVTLVDVPGFLPGLAQERGGIIRHGAKMLFAYAAATVPKITVIMRKAYGGSYMAMCSRDMGADCVFAWPTAEIAVMGAQGAVRILFRREIENSADPVATEAELRAKYEEQFCTPFQAAGEAMITDVIDPSQTRSAIALALRNTLSKRSTRPPKKHGNIPL